MNASATQRTQIKLTGSVLKALLFANMLFPRVSGGLLRLPDVAFFSLRKDGPELHPAPNSDDGIHKTEEKAPPEFHSFLRPTKTGLHTNATHELILIAPKNMFSTFADPIAGRLRSPQDPTEEQMLSHHVSVHGSIPYERGSRSTTRYCSKAYHQQFGGGAALDASSNLLET